MKTVSTSTIFLIMILIATASMSLRCAARNAELKVGGLYSVDDGDGVFRVVKILVLDSSAVHIRMYANEFSTRPETVDPSSLTLGSMDDENGFGIGHLPLSREQFVKEQPVFLSQTPVTEEELEGYQMWKDGGGGVFQ